MKDAKTYIAIQAMNTQNKRILESILTRSPFKTCRGIAYIQFALDSVLYPHPSPIDHQDEGFTYAMYGFYDSVS